jgi:UDP-N-acetylmuramyl pentapeptide synthase
MINIIKKILFFKLRFVTKLILRKYQPTIIAVTGSVGKTTTVHAIHKVLSSTYSVRKGLKNYNNEVGVPLTVLGTQNPGKSFLDG